MIISYVSTTPSHASSFKLHLVDLNGNTARLETVETPQPKDTKAEASAAPNPNIEDTTGGEDTRKRKLDECTDLPMPDADSKGSINNGNEVQTRYDWNSRREDLSKLIGATPAQEVLSFLQQHEDDNANDTNCTKFYTLPLISEKQIRRSIHLLIKSSAFNLIARADNHEGRIRIWHSKFSASMPADTHSGARGGDRNNNRKKNGRKGGANSTWPTDRPDFLRFVLYKENIDTSSAVKDVVRMAHLNSKRGLGYAGMKDKRGITAQFCSVYRMEKEQLLKVNASGGNALAENAAGGGNTSTRGASIIKIGNFSYSSEEVKLGSLSGNRFDIALRNIDIGDAPGGSDKRQLVQKKLEDAGNSLKAHGFINYFGMQRFGKFGDTHKVGIAILKGESEGAVNIIMREKTDESPRIAGARRQWAMRFDSVDVAKDENAAREAEMKCARAIQRDMGRFMVCEKSIVNSLSRKPRDYKRAFSSISKNMRSMFLHAYQSYLWNMVATHRIETGGSTEVKVGDLVLVNDGKSPQKSGGSTSGLKGKAVKLVEEQDLDGRYSITEVVLPLAGSKIQYPGGSAGDLFDELMKQDGISKEDFARIGAIDRELSLGGDYRKLFANLLM